MMLYEKADAVRENMYSSRTGGPEGSGFRNLLEELADMVCDIAQALDPVVDANPELYPPDPKQQARVLKVAQGLWGLDENNHPSASQIDGARYVVENWDEGWKRLDYT